MMGLPLTVAVITYNEEGNLEQCLESIQSLCSEIVVIDSGSQDSTQDIANRYQARFEHRPWTGHVDQKNHALLRCSYPWVLSLDADERVSESLRSSILTCLQAGDELIDGYWVNRKTYYLGKWIEHAWYPEWRLRLVKQSKAKWVGINPHDKLIVEGRTKRLQGDLLHYSYKDLEDHLKRTLDYAKIGAQNRIQTQDEFRWYKLVFSPFGRFLKSLIMKQAYRDGWRGLIIAFSSMITCFAKYAFLYEERVERERNDKSE